MHTKSTFCVQVFPDNAVMHDYSLIFFKNALLFNAHTFIMHPQTGGKVMNRKEICKVAAHERWNPTIPKATHTGVLVIAGQEIACDVLEDGRRVLREKTFLSAMGRGKIGGKQRRGLVATNLPVFMQADNLTPYLGQEIRDGALPILYKGIDGRRLRGYDAKLLPEACKVYVQAEGDKVLQENQLKIAAVCRAILCGLATVGVISLVDDATGYVEKRNRDELQKILEKYISEELRAWTKKFPNEFFKQVYRLHGWEYPNLKPSHPQYVGKLINRYVYERLPPGVLDELKRKNPVNESGRRSHRHHQLLTPDVGDDNLNKQIMQVTTLMKASENLDEFNKLMERM